MTTDIMPGDTARFTIVTGGPITPIIEEITGFVQRVHRYGTGALSLSYRYATNPRGISWSCYVTPEDAARIVILDRDPNADTTLVSMLSGDVWGRDSTKNGMIS